MRSGHHATLVTGATGFVGRSLLDHLPTEAVRLALRSRATVSSTSAQSAVVGDINGQTDWAAALQDIHCVIHLAAHVHVMNPAGGDIAKMREVNTEGTERLASTAARMGVKRFIFLSTVKVNGEATTNSSFTGADQPAPSDSYGISKWQAEQKLFEIAAGSAMQAIAIRAPLVYGPGVRANFLRLMHWVYRGLPLPFGAVVNRRSMVSVWNLCDLIRTAVQSPSSPSGVLMVSDGKDLSTPQLVRHIASAMGRMPRLVGISPHALRLLGAFTGRTAEVTRLCGSLSVDIAATTSALQWTPPISVETGIQRTVQWYLTEKRRNEG